MTAPHRLRNKQVWLQMLAVVHLRLQRVILLHSGTWRHRRHWHNDCGNFLEHSQSVPGRAPQALSSILMF